MDDGKCETGDPPRDVAGPLDCRAFVATANDNTPAAVLNRRGTSRDKRVFDGSGRVFAADAWQVSGEWVPFGRGRDQAGDQQEDDARSLTFETPPLEAPIEILGAPVVTLDVASDRPIASLVVRLCDVHPSGESLRVSYGVLNLTHRDSHEQRRWRQMSATACASSSMMQARYFQPATR
jgi:predicted acyl esterase